MNTPGPLMNTPGPKDQRIAELEGALKDAKRRSDDLRKEINDQNALITDLRESVEDLRETVQSFKDAFDLARGTEPGTVSNGPLVDRFNEAVKDYNQLLDRFNSLVRFCRARVWPQPMGRPLGASKDQRQRILAHRKAGKSLRWIAEEMNLGLQTVRTVIDKKDGVDRTTLDRWQRIAPDMRQRRDRLRREKDVGVLRKRIPRLLEESAELIKRAKGLR
jgi:cell fate (sporulation/competence/biofilm development) regulator YmcA (YheA/YmcA/DUF963 family)